MSWTSLAAVLAALACACQATASGPARYDVVVAGGSAAALAAAYAAADEGARVALLEPTDWIGGQFTSSGVSAFDEAWRPIDSPDGSVALDVPALARDPRHRTPWLRDALTEIGNPGTGWVSRFCFEPRRLLEEHLEPREEQLAGRLTVYRETVVKSVAVAGRRVRSLTAIRRTPRPGVDGYDRRLSQELADWYSPDDSARFTKERLEFTAAVFLDATEWGELLALSGAPHELGADSGDRHTGQATVFCFAERIESEPVEQARPADPPTDLGFGSYRSRDDAWRRVWTYRRLLGSGPDASVGEVTLQNWGYDLATGQGGNDHPHGYLLLSPEAAAAQADDWRGGVDLAVLAAAEERAFAWHDWFRHAAPEGIDPDQITLAGDVFGTRHGLAKTPYLRDTRRSVGLGGFRLEASDLTPEFNGDRLVRETGTPFADRVAIGSYPIDIHLLAGDRLPEGIEENHPTLPYYLPLRSLTNEGFENLLVAGKTMAQSYVANASTRVHPVEWASGVAAGVVAADLAESGRPTAEAVADAERLRAKISRHTPVAWRHAPTN